MPNQQRCATYRGGIHFRLEAGMEGDSCKWFYAAQPNRKCDRPIVGYYGDRQSGRTYCAEHLRILAERTKPGYKPQRKKPKPEPEPKPELQPIPETIPRTGRGSRGGGWTETIKLNVSIGRHPKAMLAARARMRGQVE